MRSTGLPLVIGAVWLGLLAAVLTNLVTADDPPWWLWLVWTAVALALTTVEIARHRRSWSLLGGPAEPTPRDRRTALARSQRHIGTILSETLGGITPLHLALRHDGRLIDDLRPAFAAAESLLVLGAAGSGKSTELLKLADHLAQAAQDEDEPVPVILSLAGWGARRSRLRRSDTEPEALLDWLLAQARTRYGVVPDVARAWLRQRRLVLLLDGLDEVRPELRQRCARQIAELATDGAAPPLVVTCRTPDYAGLDVRLAVTATVEPLTPQQIEHYVKDLPPDLRDVIDAPLWLRVLLTVSNRVDLTAENPDTLRRRLLDAYVLELAGRRGTDATAVLRYLSTLIRMARYSSDPDVVHLGMRSRKSYLPDRAYVPFDTWVWPYTTGAIVALAFVAPLALHNGVTAGLIGVVLGALIAPVGWVVAPQGVTHAVDPTVGHPLRRLAGVAAGLLLGFVLGATGLVIADRVAAAPGFLWPVVIGVVVYAQVRVMPSEEQRALARNLSASVSGLVVAVPLWWLGAANSDFGLGFVATVTTLASVLGFAVSGRENELEVPADRVVTDRRRYVRAVITTLVLGAAVVGYVVPADVPAGSGWLFGGVAAGLVLGVIPALFLSVLIDDVFTLAIHPLVLRWAGLMPWRTRAFLRDTARLGLLLRDKKTFRFPHLLLRTHIQEIDGVDGRISGAAPDLVIDRAVVRAEVEARLATRAHPRLPLWLRDRRRTYYDGDVVLQAFQGTNRAMVLVGDEGIGKSLLLAELARDLLDSGDPLLPVLVDISTWPGGGRAGDVTRPFTGWLLARLAEQYGITPDLALHLISEHRLALLFDGFENFTDREEGRVIAVVEEFRAAYRDPPVVLTSRSPTVQVVTGIERVHVSLDWRAARAVLTAGGETAFAEAIDADHRWTSLAMTPNEVYRLAEEARPVRMADAYVERRVRDLPAQTLTWLRRLVADDGTAWKALRDGVLLPGFFLAVGTSLDVVTGLVAGVTAALVGRPPTADRTVVRRAAGAAAGMVAGATLSLAAHWIGRLADLAVSGVGEGVALGIVLGAAAVGGRYRVALALFAALITVLSPPQVWWLAAIGLLVGAGIGALLSQARWENWRPHVLAWTGLLPWPFRRFERQLLDARLITRAGERYTITDPFVAERVR